MRDAAVACPLPCLQAIVGADSPLVFFSNIMGERERC
jgi:hypothetical protein